MRSSNCWLARVAASTKGWRDGNGLDLQERDSRDGLYVKGQLGDLDAMFAQSSRDPGWGPAKPIECFEGHQAMGDFTQDVCRDEAG